MIRYVLAAILTVAIFALAAPAIERGASMNTEREVEAGVADLEEAKTSLAENEELSPEGHPDPQRVVPIEFPRGGLTTVEVDHFEVVPHEEGFTTVRYVLEDGTTRESTFDELIVYDDPDELEPLEMGGTGTKEIRLVLQADEDGEPVVVANPA